MSRKAKDFLAYLSLLLGFLCVVTCMVPNVQMILCLITIVISSISLVLKVKPNEYGMQAAGLALALTGIVIYVILNILTTGNV